ncbi:MAG: NUDIX domain-containing protein [Deltaproteobacteria bacterium]|nr:NUDIX domain-containing protein [Deltaproteobacteria bacterium]
MTERILAVPREALTDALVRPRAAVGARTWGEVEGLLGLEHAAWVPRGRAEQDPSWKQVIPYMVFEAPDGGVLAYPRQGREARLHAHWSVGVGGHVEDSDRADPGGWGPLLDRAARREAEEECPCRWLGGLEVLGVINEEETEVGRVHVGVCLRLAVDPGSLSQGDRETAGRRWVAPASPLAALPEGASFEIWSELALGLLDGRGGPG